MANRDDINHQKPQSSPQTKGVANDPDTPTSKPQCTCPRQEEDGTQTTPAPNSIHWGKVAIGVALVGVAVPILATGSASAVLPLVGFTSEGIAACSVAAAAESYFYGAFTTGLFSKLTSLGATIVAPSAAEMLSAAGAAGAGGAMIRSGAKRGEKGSSRGVGDLQDREDGEDDDETLVECSCAQCVCDSSCGCPCRRQRPE